MTLEELKSIPGKNKLFIVSLESIRNYYHELNRPTTRAVYDDDNNVYLSFENLKEIQFKIEDVKNKSSLSFIENLDAAYINYRKNNFFQFLQMEFFQGTTFGKRLIRFISILGIILLLNILLFLFGTLKTVSSAFVAILSAVSIFIAIFSVFTINHEHLERKKMYLFKTGKLGYYLSVDRNLTIIGFFAILSSLFGILITKEDSYPFFPKPYQFQISHFKSEKLLILLLINVSFTFGYITLRSIVEFYIHRPAKYILGEMKDKFLDY